MGLNIISAANLVSAYLIIADLYSDRLELAKVGVMHLINTMETDFSDKIYP